MQVKFMRLTNGAELALPSYATDGSAGMDIRSAESFKLFSGQTKAFATGFAVEVPAGFELQVRSRGGLAAKAGIFVTNGPGTIDEDYRGEIMVILSHLGRNAYQIEHGERIAQLVLAPVTRYEAVEVNALSESSGRGEGRFGSTGRR